MKKLNALSLFAGGGIAETYYKDLGIDVVVANELLQDRANFYKFCYPNTEMISGDITDITVFSKVIDEAKKANVNLIIATPPCQGMSTLGKKQYETDDRNELVWYAIEAIKILCPDYVMIENVPKFIKLKYEYDGLLNNIVDILNCIFGNEYNIEVKQLNAMDYGVPQRRPRIIIKLFKKTLLWPWPKEEDHVITLEEAIGDLPSLESGQNSNIMWHNALVHSKMQIEAMKHTPEGKSAMKNPIYYPKKKDGSPVKGFHNTYKRMKWNEPSPARTTNSHLISGHNNVHPGKLLSDNTWSDARVLTLRELIIVSSLPLNWNIPSDIKEPFIRKIIGEAIPPLLSKKIVEKIL